MDRELEIETNLKHELHSTQETLTRTRTEISVRAKFTGVKESLQITLDKARLSGDAVVGELFATKELIKKTNDELQVLSHKLIVVAKKHDSLHEELADVYKKVERALSDLKKENKIVSSLKKEVKALYKQISKDKELGEEREGLDKRSKKLEKELVSAKGEILRLRNQINSSKDLVNNQQPLEEAEEPIVDANFFLLDLGQNCTYKTINTFG
ncbi:unnamed protein product [Malus baccata var. baccata]